MLALALAALAVLPLAAARLGGAPKQLPDGDFPPPSSAARRPFRDPPRPVAPGERRALVELYAATGGRHWLNRRGWADTGTDPCLHDWFGVSCRVDADTWRYTVTVLKLPLNNLTGSLPALVDEAAWAQQKAARYAALHNLHNQGNIPIAVTREHIAQLLASEPPPSLLPNLEAIDFGNNYLRGTLPPSITSLERLVTLRVSSNRFEGTLPRLNNLRRLRTLDVSSNRFRSPFPSMTAIHELLHIDVSRNLLSEPIDALLLPSLRSLVAVDTGLNGTLPGKLCDLSELRMLTISLNKIEGRIPACTADRLSKLAIFYAHSNKFSGPLPAGLGNMRALSMLDLSVNSLSGAYPASLANSTISRWNLRLTRNNLDPPPAWIRERYPLAM